MLEEGVLEQGGMVGKKQGGARRRGRVAGGRGVMLGRRKGECWRRNGDAGKEGRGCCSKKGAGGRGLIARGCSRFELWVPTWVGGPHKSHCGPWQWPLRWWQ